MTNRKQRNEIHHVWAIRAGKGGSAHNLFIERSVIALADAHMGNLSRLEKSREAFYALYRNKHPEETRTGSAGIAGKYYRFALEVSVNDLIIFPALTRTVHVGLITGEYQFVKKSDYPHQRTVRWLNEYPKTAFAATIQREFGAARTFFEIKRHADVFLRLADKDA